MGLLAFLEEKEQYKTNRNPNGQTASAVGRPILYAGL